MQMATADAMKDGKGDVVVLSPTGTGKTLAYLLPLAEMINPHNDNVQAVVIVPGRRNWRCSRSRCWLMWERCEAWLVMADARQWKSIEL